jgi:hypothetical protein
MNNGGILVFRLLESTNEQSSADEFVSWLEGFVESYSVEWPE